MRKHITGDDTWQSDNSSRSGDWLDLEQLARVEITSEDAEHPVESALLQDDKSGWLASQPGKQTNRLVFDNPQKRLEQ